MGAAAVRDAAERGDVGGEQSTHVDQIPHGESKRLAEDRLMVSDAIPQLV
jgi:hypothetical protein